MVQKNVLQKVSIFVGIVILFLLLIGVQQIRTQNFSNSKELRTVTFSPKWVNNAQFAGIFVAKSKRFYAENNLEVKIDEFKVGDSVLNDLTQGTSQFGLMSAQEFLSYYSQGYPIKVVAAFYQVSPYVIASLKSNNIDSPTEFKGKVLGIKGGSGAEAQAVYDLILASSGLTKDDVTFTTLGLETTEQEDLFEERVDVIGFYRTRLYQFDKEGALYDLFYPEQYGASLYNDVLVVTEDFLKNNPDTVRDFVDATITGWEYAYDNKQEAIDITMSYVKADSYEDIEYQKYILEQSESLMRVGNQKIGFMTLDKWKRSYDALLNRGLLQKEFNVSDVFTTEFLKK